MGKRLRALRLASGLSQTEAAARLGIKQPSLSALESGDSKTLGGETLAMACKTFHTTAEYIWFGSQTTDDPELPLVEAELIYMARALPVKVRQTLLAAARGIYNGEAGNDKNNPFNGREPGDSQPADLDVGAKLRKQKRLGIPLAKAKKVG